MGKHHLNEDDERYFKGDLDPAKDLTKRNMEPIPEIPPITKPDLNK